MKRTFAAILTVLTLLITAASPMSSLKAQAADQTTAMNARLLADINNLRAEQGLPALTLDAELTTFAAVRSQEIVTNWSHTRPDGTSGCDMISRNKWRGENLSYIIYGSFGFSDAEQTGAADTVFASLKASPTHYSNMVSGNYTKIGICTCVTNTGNGIKLSTAYMFSN